MAARPRPTTRRPRRSTVICGIGPRTVDRALYAAISVRGPPAAAALAPLNVALVLDRSGSMHGRAVPQHDHRRRDVRRPAARRRPRLGGRVLRRRLRGGAARDHRRRTRATAVDRRHPLAAGRRRDVLLGRHAGRPGRGLQRVPALAGQPGRSCSPTASPTSASPARPSWRASRRAPPSAASASPRSASAWTTTSCLMQGDRRRVGRQLLLRRQPGRHVGHLPARGGRDPAQRRARDRHRSGAAAGARSSKT